MVGIAAVLPKSLELPRKERDVQYTQLAKGEEEEGSVAGGRWLDPAAAPNAGGNAAAAKPLLHEAET